MISSIIIGILSSTAAEMVTAFNKKLQGTVLQGDAAFIIALLTALIGGTIKVFWIDGVPLPSLHDMKSFYAVWPQFAQVWTISQVYFLLVTQKLNLDVVAPSQKMTFGGQAE
jgi:hypothetical protein